MRRFLGMSPDEPTELTFFYQGRIAIAHAMNAKDHVRLLREGERRDGFNGAYCLVNGPLVPEILARYEPNKIHRAWNGRVADEHIQQRRAAFIDVDPKRIKGISATDDEKNAALEVAHAVGALLTERCGRDAIGFGDSGNGAFLLVALEPFPPSEETTKRMTRLLTALNRKFGTARVEIDCSTFNAARLMPAAGTMKCKGWSTAERPHRMTSFSCTKTVARVPLEAIA
jgi:hypothetical protein